VLPERFSSGPFNLEREMKTYILEENYGETYRVTVEDDVTCSVNTYEGNHEGSLVKFTVPQLNNYNDQLHSAFGRVSRVYLEGTDIEKKGYNIPEVAKAEASMSTAQDAVWARV
jgi:hypothetical protein